ncbi:MAG: flagellar biosynthetic protein FliR [Syntrophobacteraceae bacterium]|nr:flagellar biosynthetic protein FliR [Desulfobacteraceae bacterium]
MLNLSFGIYDFALFTAVFLRLSFIVFMLPVFSSPQIPNQLKACFTIAFTAMLYPYLRDIVNPLAFEPISLVTVIVGEMIFGLIFSISILIIFSAFQLAGDLVTSEMGFGFAQMADPQSGGSSMIFSVWFHLMAMLLFFTLNGHHIVLKIIVESFRSVPIGSFALDAEIFQKIIALSTRLFVIAIKISAPVLVVLLLTYVGMGLIAKFAPQINILTTSFPITIIVGLIFMSFSVLVWGNAMQDYYNQLYHFLQNLVRR